MCRPQPAESLASCRRLLDVRRVRRDQGWEDEMPVGKTLCVANRDDWRAWLADHHETETAVWLIYYKKHTGRPRIPYDDAVEEALCFGWIDSTVRRIDDAKFAQQFTPRRDINNWSALNRRRMR